MDHLTSVVFILVSIFQMFAIFSSCYTDIGYLSCLTFSGRLTLTNYALYFEPGVGLYDKAVKYELATDLKQVIKPELTGPLGARLFDKAVMYKSTSMYGF